MDARKTLNACFIELVGFLVCFFSEIVELFIFLKKIYDFLIVLRQQFPLTFLGIRSIEVLLCVVGLLNARTFLRLA